VPDDREITQTNMHVHLSYLIEDVKEIKAKLERDYITRQEFDPIKRIVYGVVFLIIAGVIKLLLGVIV